MSESLHSTLCGLELRLLEPATRRDSVALQALLAEDFVEIGARGEAWNRQQVIVALLEEDAPRRTLEDFEVRPLAETLALVTYRCCPTEGAGRASLRSSIWRREGPNWRMAFHQGTYAAR